MKLLKFLIIILLIASPPIFSSAENIQNYIKKTSNRYSKHFDKNGWFYTQPSYLTLRKSPKTAREWMMFASYYFNREKKTDKTKIKISINNAYQEIQNRPTTTQSFEDSIAHFLMYTQKNQLGNLFLQELNLQIYNSLNARLKVKDTENRAIIAGILDSYLAKQLRQENFITKKQYQKLIQKNIKKINKGISKCVDQDFWYFEGQNKYFSAHYHILSAYLLMFYGNYFNNVNYLSLAHKMTENTRKISFENGFIEAKIGMRPIGLGAQTYLMLGLLNKRYNYKDYSVYLNYMKPRFFYDKANTNRLEFHSTLESSKPNYHDDIGFSLVAEISKLDKKINKTKFKKNPVKLNIKDKIYKDNRFTIQNFGEIIKINNKQYSLATNGDYSRIITIK